MPVRAYIGAHGNASVESRSAFNAYSARLLACLVLCANALCTISTAIAVRDYAACFHFGAFKPARRRAVHLALCPRGWWTPLFHEHPLVHEDEGRYSPPSSRLSLSLSFFSLRLFFTSLFSSPHPRSLSLARGVFPPLVPLVYVCTSVCALRVCREIY